MNKIITPGYLRWDGSKFVTDPSIEIVGPSGPPGPQGPPGPGGGGGSQTLAQTLGLGNSTIGHQINVSENDEIDFEGSDGEGGLETVASIGVDGLGDLNIRNTGGIILTTNTFDRLTIDSNGNTTLSALGGSAGLVINGSTGLLASLPNGSNGKLLTMVSGSPAWQTPSAGFTAGGDLSGSSSSQTVIKLQNRAVASTAPTDGYVLTWVAGNNDWEPKPSAISFTAGGDLSGTNTSQTVIKLQNRTVASTAPTDGYVLTWVAGNSDWEPKSIPNSFTAGNDLSGTGTSQTVIRINGASVPAAGSLTTGNVLQVSGSSALSYGAVNLAGGSNYVTGKLPIANVANGNDGYFLVTSGSTAVWSSASSLGIATKTLTVDSSSTTSLPSYSYNNGSSGFGATITANSNGVAPVLDGIAAVVGKTFLLQNGASPSDNGPYQWISVGSVSTTWQAVRVPGFDTASGVLESRIRVAGGSVRFGREYIYNNPSTPTIGTTGLFWIPTGRIPTDQGFDLYEDFSFGTTLTVSAATGSGSYGWLLSAVGTGATATLTFSNNSDTVQGTSSVTTGTTTTGTSTVYTGWGNNSINVTNSYNYFKWKIQFPILSDGTNTFDGYVGIADSPSNNSLFFWLNSNTDSHFRFGASNAGVFSLNTSSVVGVAGQYYNLEAWKYAGENIYHFAIDGVEQGTVGSSFIPSSFSSGVIYAPSATKKAGTTARTMLCDCVEVRVFNPLGRGA